ncbi:MAG: hypothetical protein ACR2GZ_07700 [Solirubrobacteraceae bacterium]
MASDPRAAEDAGAAAAALQRLPAQTTVFAQGDGPLEHLWVIRAGAVEIVSEGRVLDLPRGRGAVDCRLGARLHLHRGPVRWGGAARNA